MACVWQWKPWRPKVLYTEAGKSFLQILQEHLEIHMEDLQGDHLSLSFQPYDCRCRSTWTGSKHWWKHTCFSDSRMSFNHLNICILLWGDNWAFSPSYLLIQPIGPCGTNHCWGKPSSFFTLLQICVEGKWHGWFLLSKKSVLSPQGYLLPVAPKSKGASCNTKWWV